MIEKFQQLPTVTKIVILFLVVSVLGGLLLLAAFLTVGGNDPEPTETTGVTDSTPTPTGPPQVIQPTPTGTPTRAPQPTQGPHIPSDTEIRQGIPMTDEDLDAAYAQATAGYAAYCLQNNGDSTEVRTSRMAPYFTEDSLPLFALQNPFVKVRECYIMSWAPLSSSGTDNFVVNVGVHQATITPDQTTENEEAFIEEFSSEVTMQRTADGTWKIAKISENTGPIPHVDY